MKDKRKDEREDLHDDSEYISGNTAIVILWVVCIAIVLIGFMLK